MLHGDPKAFNNVFRIIYSSLDAYRIAVDGGSHVAVDGDSSLSLNATLHVAAVGEGTQIPWGSFEGLPLAGPFSKGQSCNA